MSHSNNTEAIVAWMHSATPGLMPIERDIRVDVPAGWTHLVRETCRELETPAWPRKGHVPPTVNAIGTHQGRLVVELAGGTDEDRAIVDVARALSGETCDRCAKRGDPVEDPSGASACRCRGCRTPEHRQMPREWTPPWTDEERARERRAEHVMRMMAANDDDKWTDWWPEMPGWTGLVRALVIAMRAQMDSSPGAAQERWTFPWMKEKWGEIRMESHGRTAYQGNAQDFCGDAERDAVPHVRGTCHDALLRMGEARMRRLLGASAGRGASGRPKTPRNAHCGEGGEDTRYDDGGERSADARRSREGRKLRDEECEHPPRRKVRKRGWRRTRRSIVDSEQGKRTRPHWEHLPPRGIPCESPTPTPEMVVSQELPDCLTPDRRPRWSP